MCCACLCCVENDRERSRVALAVDDPLPPTAEVARCDLLAQLGVLLIADSQQTSSSSSSSRSAAVTGQPSGLPPPPRSTSSPGMLQPDDSVPCVDTSPNSTVPKDDSVDLETAASGMLYIAIKHSRQPIYYICCY